MVGPGIQNNTEQSSEALTMPRLEDIVAHPDMNVLFETGANPADCSFLASMGAAGIELYAQIKMDRETETVQPTIRELLAAQKLKESDKAVEQAKPAAKEALSKQVTSQQALETPLPSKRTVSPPIHETAVPYEMALSDMQKSVISIEVKPPLQTAPILEERAKAPIPAQVKGIQKVIQPSSPMEVSRVSLERKQPEVTTEETHVDHEATVDYEMPGLTEVSQPANMQPIALEDIGPLTDTNTLETTELPQQEVLVDTERIMELDDANKVYDEVELAESTSEETLTHVLIQTYIEQLQTDVENAGEEFDVREEPLPLQEHERFDQLPPTQVGRAEIIMDTIASRIANIEPTLLIDHDSETGEELVENTVTELYAELMELLDIEPQDSEMIRFLHQHIIKRVVFLRGEYESQYSSQQKSIVSHKLELPRSGSSGSNWYGHLVQRLGQSILRSLQPA